MDSVPPRKHRATPAENRNRGPFLRQSFRSNYCGVYSAGMLLSQLGLLTTRHEALRLFNLKRSNPDYPGSSLEAIATAFTTATDISDVHWEYQRTFDFYRISKSVLTHFQNTAAPTLISFGAIHKNGKWKCLHVAVVLRASDNRIDLLDPLGQPQFNRGSNVQFVRNDHRGRSVNVIGSSYRIDRQRLTAVLRWTGRNDYVQGRNH